MANKTLTNVPSATDIHDTDNVIINQGNAVKQVPFSKLKTESSESYNEENYYGVRITLANTSPDLTRIGLSGLHKTLPIQSGMRRCLLSDNGVVADYLGATDSAVNAYGQKVALDGSAGQVMVEIPEHYRKFETTNAYIDVKLSTQPLAGFTRVPKMYVSAFEAALDRTSRKLSSVVNTTEQYRGGNNTSSWDGTYRSLLGMPATNISLTDFRTYARNRGAEWDCMTYEAQKTIYWLFAAEYATLDSQKAYNAALDSNGYRQGGLGAGVTNFGNWGAYNSMNPFIPCGYTASLGNATGVRTFALSAEQAAAYGSSHSESVPSYRGIENPFGHIWQWTDGVLNVVADGVSSAYICKDRSHYASALNGYYVKHGEMPAGGGWISKVIMGDDGDILPSGCSGGDSGKFYCDYLWNTASAGTCGVLLGGGADLGAACGFVCSLADPAPSSASAGIGSRLCRHCA